MTGTGSGILRPKADDTIVTEGDALEICERMGRLDLVDLVPLTLPLDGRPMNIRNARPMFTPLFRKQPLARRQMFLCGRQIGKALALDTPIPTPSGWTTMGELSVGDIVFDDSGKPTRVVKATDTMRGRDCYRITFDDGSSVVADAEHLWEVERTGERRNPRIVTTLEWIELQPKRKKSARFSIKATTPIELPEADLPIDPYLFGYWLGDGNSGDARIHFGERDFEEAFARIEGRWADWRDPYIDKRTRVRTMTPAGLKQRLLELGVLKNKHIPGVYLRASFGQRLELVRGLMDSDGSVRKAGGCENTQKVRAISDGLRELLASLGIKSRLRRRTINGTDYWTVGFATQLQVFRLPRKAKSHCRSTDGNHKNGRHYARSIERVDSVPVRCIEVDSPNHLFLCGRSMIPTHNTASAAAVSVMNLIWRRGFRVLYVAPLALYTNRLHHLYMGPMVRRNLLFFPIQDRHCVNNVLEKTFMNGSHFHGVSCFNSAGNAIGIPTDMNVYDEVQDLNWDHIPQIRETLGNSDYRFELFFGTARGIDNTIAQLFEQSTQSEFAIKCSACGYWNIPSKDRDAIGMIQRHGIACAKRDPQKGICGKLLDVEKGQWVHAYPSRARDFVGWHVPQTIVRARITPHSKYLDTIYSKLCGTLRYSEAKFLQEILGISTDQGNTPLTKKDVDEASVLDIGPNSPVRQNQYSHFAGGADWGGSEIVSFTVGAVVGWHPGSGSFHCVGAIRPTGVPDNERHLPLAYFFRNTITHGRMELIGADAGFVGSVQNKNLERVMGGGVQVGSIAYGSLKRFFHPYPNNLFTVDRTTLLHIVFSLIKSKRLLFPKGEWFEVYTQDLLTTFIEEIERGAATIQQYKKRPTQADDFLHALGYAVFMCAIANGGIDLPSMIGMDPASSLTARVIEEIGVENHFRPGEG